MVFISLHSTKDKGISKTVQNIKLNDPYDYIENLKLFRPPVDGSMKCPNGTQFGNKCLFDCLPGFQMIGFAQMTCREDERNVPEGVWSKESAFCERKF